MLKKSDRSVNFGGMRPPCAVSGTHIRLGRIVRPDTGRSLVATVCHGLFNGPYTNNEPKHAAYGPLIRDVAESGADAVITTPGMIGHLLDSFTGKQAPALILCLEWNNIFRDRESMLGFSEGRQCIIASVENAVRMGADGILTYLFLGFDDAETEAKQVEVNGLISRECERYGMVRIIETMARGSRLTGKNVCRPEYVRLHSRMAAEIGADLIKTEYTGDTESFRSVVEHCPVPILAAGGPLTESPRDALVIAENVMQAGAMGIVFGRNILQASNPSKMTAALARVIHDRWSVDEAAKELA